MKRFIVLFPLIALGGCVDREHYVVRERQPVYDEPQTAVIEDDRPLVEGPGVVVIQQEPPPVERVYIYDPGYPPGTYIYGDYYYYGGHRYERDVFINRVVNVNVREHHFVNVNENRNIGHRFEQTHRTMYAETGGRRDPNYLHKLRAGEKQQQKAFEYGQKLKAEGAKEEAKKYQYGQEQKQKSAQYEAEQRAKAGRYESDQSKKAGRYESDQSKKAGRYEGEQKAKAGAYEQQRAAEAGRAQPARVNNSAQIRAEQERERLEAAQAQKNKKKPQEQK